MKQSFYDSLISKKQDSELRTISVPDDTLDILDKYENMLMSFKSMQKSCKKFIADIGEDWFLKNKDSFISNECINAKGSYVLIEYKNGVKKEMLLTAEEVRVIKYAVLHNYSIINLLSKTEVIKSLINKGLIEISDEEGLLRTSSVADVIVNNGSDFYDGSSFWLYLS